MNHQKNESEKPARSPIIAGLDQGVKAPWGMCPLMSRSQAVVTSHSPGEPRPIISGPKITSLNMEVPCVGPRCQWWIPEWESCCVRGIARLPELAAALEPAEGVNIWIATIIKNKKALERVDEKFWRLKAEVDDLRIRLTGSEDSK